MNRRHFIKQKLAGTAILAASGLVHKASAENLPSPDPDNADLLDVDVLVVGGGSAGHVAAIQAAYDIETVFFFLSLIVGIALGFIGLLITRTRQGIDTNVTEAVDFQAPSTKL